VRRSARRRNDGAPSRNPDYTLVCDEPTKGPITEASLGVIDRLLRLLLTPSRPENEPAGNGGTESELDVAKLQVSRHFAWSRQGFESP
jgi:hypothetical protein